MKISNRVESNIIVNADKELLKIVCGNLLGNAIKYGRPGGNIIITANSDKSELYVSFYNDGLPIPKTISGLLFNKFSRLPGTENIKGTGLGLFIVREIIQKHDGKVVFEQKENGNAFIFSLNI